MKLHRLHRIGVLAGLALAGLGVPDTASAAPSVPASPTPQQTEGCLPPPANMVRWWTFDNRSSLFTERTSNVISTVATPAVSVAGKVAGGAAFSATRADSPAPVIGLRDFSMDVWVKTTQVTGYFADTRPAGIGKGWVLGINNGRPLFQMNSGGTTQNGLAFNYIAPTTVNDGQWHLLGVTVDRDGNVVISVDGATKLTSPAKYPTADLTGTTLKMGLSYIGGLDEFEIFNRALAPREIAALFEVGPRGKCKPACVTPPANMLRWWTFDNARNLFAERVASVASGAPTAANATASGVSGFVAGAARLIATSVSASAPPAVGTGDFSIDVWVKTTQATGYFLDTRGSMTGTGWLLGNYNGRPLFQLNSGGTTAAPGLAFNYIAGGAAINDGQWHLVAVTVDRDGNVVMSVDGVVRLTTPAKYPAANLTGTKLRIGAPIHGTPFVGEIDELEIFRRVLTPAEVSSLAKAGTSGKCKPACVAPPANMIRWWTFDNARNLFAERLANVASTVVTPGVGTAGKVAGSASFSATRADSPAPVVGLRDFSMDVWVKTTQVTGYFADTRSTGTGKGWVLGINNGRPLFQMNSGGTTQNGLAFNYIAPVIVNDGQWHLLAVTVDRDGNVVISVDGSTKLTAPAKYPAADLTGTTLKMGLSYVGGLDEFEIFNRVLAASEVHGLFNAGANGKCKLG